MVQRVPAHLGETTGDNLPPWVIIAGIVLLILVVCAALFILLGGANPLGFRAPTATPTRPSRTTTPAVTILPVTLPAPPSPTVGPTAATVKYKVKSGDTLSAIAVRYKVSVQAIMAANGLKDETIRAGEELLIPLPTPTSSPGSYAPAPPGTPTTLSLDSPPPSASSAATPGVIRHIVKRGETLSEIAAIYKSSVEAIRLANQLPNAQFLSVGQELIVPLGAWTPTATRAPVANVTPTPTAPFAYAAPNLLWPPDKHTVAKSDAPTLSWESPAMLKPNEFYVVHVEYVAGNDTKTLPSLTIRQGTSVKLDPAVYYPGANPSGWQFSWYVVVVSQSAATAPGQSPQIWAQSPPSKTWTFVWR